MKVSIRPKVKRNAFTALIFAMLVGTFAWGSVQATQKQEYKRALESVYTKSFDELATSFGALVTTLDKLRIASSYEQTVQLLNEASSLSGKCSAVISQLPASYTDFGPLSAMISQAGDYCQTLARSATQDIPLSDYDRQQLGGLYNAAALASATIGDLRENGQPLAVLSAVDYFTGVEGGLSFQPQEGQQLYPTLIYDGPFSDSTAKLEPRGLGEGEVDVAQAQAIAESFTGMVMQRAGEVDGRLAAFAFDGKTAAGEDVSVRVSRYGGRVISMNIDVAAKQTIIPDDDKIAKLKEAGHNYILNRGFGETEATYAQYYDGVALINYASVQDGILLYNDLVKVWMDVTTGEVVGFDSTNYLFSHTRRAIPLPEISAEEAMDGVSSLLRVLSVRLAVVPKTPSREVLCYELKCTSGQESYILYINAVSGAEEQIFKIINTGSGTLVL